MSFVNLQYQIGHTAIEIITTGVSHYHPNHVFNDDLSSKFLKNTIDIDYTVTLEIHALPVDFGIDLEKLILCHNLDDGRWIYLSFDKWIALFNEQESRFVLFLRNFRVFSEAYKSTLSFLFKYFTKDIGTFFHSAGIQIADHNYIFLAPSGTGKTTLSLRAQKGGLPVLSDEMVFVSKNGGCFVAYSSPFGRITDGPLEAPLGGIFFLKQGTAARFSRINSSQALARAWQDSYYRDTVLDFSDQKLRFKNRIVTPAERLKIFDLWHELFSTVPCFEMEFPIDFDDWHKLAELVENA
ncbi:MAG: hypothetical protein KJ047_05560 [Anaerolineae bacterium]|nr:hypothetical protein [Anaerolineae bacterium]